MRQCGVYRSNVLGLVTRLALILLSKYRHVSAVPRTCSRCRELESRVATDPRLAVHQLTTPLCFTGDRTELCHANCYLLCLALAWFKTSKKSLWEGVSAWIALLRGRFLNSGYRIIFWRSKGTHNTGNLLFGAPNVAWSPEFRKTPLELISTKTLNLKGFFSLDSFQIAIIRHLLSG